MNREGQTWCAQHLGVVFTVVRSHAPTRDQQWWVHEIVYLDDKRGYAELGTKQVLPEVDGAFDKETTLLRVA
jgi:hypothetical protein